MNKYMIIRTTIEEAQLFHKIARRLGYMGFSQCVRRLFAKAIEESPLLTFQEKVDAINVLSKKLKK